MRLHIFNAHFFPINFQLFGNQHGGGGTAALAHFGSRIADHDGFISMDVNPCIDLLGVAGLGLRGQYKTQAERCSGAGADLQKASTVKDSVSVHD